MPSHINAILDLVKSPIRSLQGDKPSRVANAASASSVSSRSSAERKRIAAETKQLDKEEKVVKRELAKLTKEKEVVEKHDRDPARERYGVLLHAGHEVKDNLPRGDFRTIRNVVSQCIMFRARVQNIRPMSAKLAFIVFRQQLLTVQGVLCATDEEGGISENMVRWAEKLPKETIVLVEGFVRDAQQEVISTEVHRFEMDVLKLHVISEVTDVPAWTVAEASRSVELDDDEQGDSDVVHTGRIAGISLQSRLQHRAMDLRTPTNQAIFRVQALVCRYARSYLDDRGFIEIHTTKLQPAATESGSGVFKVDYFQRAAYLAQSPQLAKETCISADFERVYEIGPVFRAENSNTHRHMTEFTGIDIEMAIERSYLETRSLIDGMLKHVFRSILQNHQPELDKVKRQFPHDDLVFPDDTVILDFHDGIRLLKDDGWTEGGEELDEYEDLSRRGEVRLGQLVKEKYNTDYYILDKFPLDVRPFYTMPDPDDPRLSNSFDIFVRGEEILSGGQRLHSAYELEKQLEEACINPEEMRDYVNAFRWGMPPHAGGGIGLERLVMLFLKLSNLRNASLFPRDPKSFPDAASAAGIHIHNDVELPHVTNVVGFDEPTVVSQDDMKKPDHPPLEDLIARHGDSTHTAWTDPGYKVWRHDKTGAAIGYIHSHGHSVSWGYPLCPYANLSEVIIAYVAWLGEKDLKPIWLNVDARTEKILADELDWRALSVTADQRIRCSDPATYGNKNVHRKVHAAERAGMTVQIITGEISDDLREEIDKGIREWQSSRAGTQVHTTMVRPWADCRHRSYFVGRDKDGKACGLISIAKLAPEHGYQIKWALAFPNSPQGTSEKLLSYVIDEMRNAGVVVATFGAGAKDTLEVIDNIRGIKAKLLSQVYQAIVSSFSLTNKSRYREKFGAFEDPLYICYPNGSLGLQGVEAIMGSVKDPQKNRDKRNAMLGNSKSPSDSSPSGSSTVVSINSTKRKLKEIDENAAESHPFSTGT